MRHLSRDPRNTVINIKTQIESHSKVLEDLNLNDTEKKDIRRNGFTLRHTMNSASPNGYFRSIGFKPLIGHCEFEIAYPVERKVLMKVMHNIAEDIYQKGRWLTRGCEIEVAGIKVTLAPSVQNSQEDHIRLILPGQMSV